ncbi:MAG: GNAT family N-acetyltransferase [Bacteroidales bacterium]
MQIVDLTEDNKQTFFLCLQEWSEELKDAVSAKEAWYNHMKNKGLRVKLGLNEQGVAGGMIQYFPIEHSWIEGEELYFISCIWVHPNKRGAGNFQKKGLGKALLQAAVDDAKASGSKGIVAWGTSLPFWMRANWYKKQGFTPVDSTGFLGDLLLWQKFTDDAIPPCWIKPKKKPGTPDTKVHVTCLTNGWCTAMNLACCRAKDVAGEFGDHVTFEEINTAQIQNKEDFGKPDALYIDGKKISMGPPPSKEKLRKMIGKRLEK